MAEQLSFPLPARVRMEAEDFFVAPANAAAHEMVTGPAPWPEGKLALVGPEGSGKTHLVRVWAAGTGAAILQAPALDPAAPLPPAGAFVALEDADRLPVAAEEAVFHLHNHLRRTGGRLLVTGRTPPAAWPVRLPDLASRLQAAAVARLDDPDDALLAAVLMKQFHDRQLAPAADVVPYLVTRIDRSFAEAARVVAAIDRAALAERQRVTRNFAAKVLARGG